MPTEFESGAREEIRWAELADQHDLSSADNFQILPHGGNPSGPSKPWSRGPTDEVTSDYTVQDNAARSFTVPMSIQNVVRYGIYDLPIQQVLNEYWTDPFTTGSVTTIQSIATGNKLHPTAGTPFAALGPMLPCPVWLCRNGVTAITGRPVLALSLDADDLVLAVDGANGITLTDVAAGANVVVMHSGILKHGVEHIYAIIERAQLGLGHYRVGHGMIGTKLAFSGAKGSDPTWSLDFMGLDADRATTTFGTGTEVAAPTALAFNMGSNFKHARLGGEIDLNLFYQKIDYTIDAGVSAVDPAGQDGPYAHQKKQFKINGALTFFSNDESAEVADTARAAGELPLWFGLYKTQGGVTRGYQKWIPKAQFEGEDSQEGGGSDGILMTPLKWLAARDPNFGGLEYCLARFTGVPLSL